MSCVRDTARRLLEAGLMLSAALVPGIADAKGPPPGCTLADARTRPPEDDIIYLVMPDHFANGDPSNDRGGHSDGLRP